MQVDVKDMGLISGLGGSPGEGNDNPLQYSCMENPMDEQLGGLQFMGSQELETATKPSPKVTSLV